LVQVAGSSYCNLKIIVYWKCNVSKNVCILHSSLYKTKIANSVKAIVERITFDVQNRYQIFLVTAKVHKL